LSFDQQTLSVILAFLILVDGLLVQSRKRILLLVLVVVSGGSLWLNWRRSRAWRVCDIYIAFVQTSLVHHVRKVFGGFPSIKLMLVKHLHLSLESRVESVFDVVVRSTW